MPDSRPYPWLSIFDLCGYRKWFYSDGDTLLESLFSLIALFIYLLVGPLLEANLHHLALTEIKHEVIIIYPNIKFMNVLSNPFGLPGSVWTDSSNCLDHRHT